MVVALARGHAFGQKRPQRARARPALEPGSYPCERCGKEYGYRKNMLQHLRYECGMEPQFRCPQCVRRFRRNSHLRAHILSKHPPEVVFAGPGNAALPKPSAL